MGELADVLALVLTAIGSVVVSGIGLLIESYALVAFLAGEFTTGIWMVFMGAITLYFGAYLLGYGELLPRLRALSSEN